MKKTYFNHDSNARNDLKLIRLRSAGGFEFYGIYFAILELLFAEENKICVSQYDILAYGLQCDANKLRAVIEDFDLFIIEDGCFHSRRLNNQIDEINNKSNIAKENAKKRWNNAKALQPHNGLDSKGNASKVEYSKNKLKKSNYYNDISFPDYYDIHYAKRIEQDVNKTKEYHKHLESIGYVKDINNYNGQAKWVKK